MPSVGFTKHTHLFDYDHPSGVIFMTLGLVISLAGNLIRPDKQCICTHDNEIFLSLPNYEHYEREREGERDSLRESRMFRTGTCRNASYQKL